MHSSVVTLQASEGLAHFVTFLTDNSPFCYRWWRHGVDLASFEVFALSSGHSMAQSVFGSLHSPSLTFSDSHPSHGRERTAKSGHAAITGGAVISLPSSHQTNKVTQEETHQH